MTKVLVAIDSFKGSGTSAEIADYIASGLIAASPKLVIDKVAIADGGEGTVNAIIESTQGTYITETVQDPLGQMTQATWGLINDRTAVIEIAEAVGLPLVEGREDIMQASSYGVGQLIKAAINRGAKTIYVGLGGSATNDGGVGMAQALGVKFFDQSGHLLQHATDILAHLGAIDITQTSKILEGIQIIGLSDVDNPLTGINGASAIFGPQKGASPENINVLDQYLQNLALIAQRTVGFNYANQAGAGAAGGLGFGLLAFCNAKIKPGIREIMQLIDLPTRMSTVDFVITGEGKIDGQSLGGKLPIGVAKLAKEFSLPVIAIAGSAGRDAQKVYERGIDLIITSIDRPMSVAVAIANTAALVKSAGYRAGQVIKLCATTKIKLSI